MDHIKMHVCTFSDDIHVSEHGFAVNINGANEKFAYGINVPAPSAGWLPVLFFKFDDSNLIILENNGDIGIWMFNSDGVLIENRPEMVSDFLYKAVLNSKSIDDFNNIYCILAISNSLYKNDRKTLVELTQALLIKPVLFHIIVNLIMNVACINASAAEIINIYNVLKIDDKKLLSTIYSWCGKQDFELQKFESAVNYFNLAYDCGPDVPLWVSEISSLAAYRENFSKKQPIPPNIKNIVQNFSLSVKNLFKNSKNNWIKSNIKTDFIAYQWANTHLKVFYLHKGDLLNQYYDYFVSLGISPKFLSLIEGGG